MSDKSSGAAQPQSATVHYLILDGLRGVAACAVLVYHLFEAIAFAAGETYQQMFHGFLCVDFFFVLSGFVMGHAYDARWSRMSVKDFLILRLVRLHPMVVMGALMGLVAYLLQGSVQWDGTPVPMGDVLLCALLSLFLLPSLGRLEVRGNTELFPLNGPHWSLFFEYIGSLAYALTLHRLSTRVLAALTAVVGVGMAAWGFFMTDGAIANGWSSDPVNAFGGLLRLLYAYPMGLLLARMFRNKRSAASKDNAWSIFLCPIALLALVCVPHVDGGHFDLLFQLFCVWVAFPLIVWLGACGSVPRHMTAATDWLGRLSYPLYAIHYPFIYLYIHWINRGSMPFGCPGWLVPWVLAVVCLLLASATVVCYDEPVRRWLRSRIKQSVGQKK